MRIVRTVIVALGLVVGVLALVLGAAWMRTAPEPLPAGSESAARLAPGPHSVERIELEWVDSSRPTAASGSQPRSPERVLPVSLWAPRGVGGAHPLAVYSHGFLSTRHGGTYLAEHLASYGYVVLAADYPLTNLRARGRPDFRDVVHQPADVSFLIDRVTTLEGGDRPFAGAIDPSRIGVFGLSLGAVTSTLVAFHPEWRDPRVAAAISIAGVGDVFGARFFDHAAVPFLMIAGTSDAIVDYERNALPIPDRIRVGGLLSIAGGTHVGFTRVAAGLMRILGNPDRVACRLGEDPGAAPENPFNGLFGGTEQGLLDVSEYPAPCARTRGDVISAGRQQMLTTLAVRSFFESRFAPEPEARAEHAAFLTRTLPAELSEVRYVPARR